MSTLGTPARPVLSRFRRPGTRSAAPLAAGAVALLAACQGAVAGGEADAGSEPGWTILFDGRDASAWRGFKQETLPEGWEVEGGCLVRNGPGGDIVTKEQFGDFVLELQWRVSPGGNSGIFFRVDERHDHVWESGPEMQVLDNALHADGKSAFTSAGSNYALHAPVRDVTRPAGEFNLARIEVRGPNVKHFLNGVQILEYDLWGKAWSEVVAASKFASMPDYGGNRRGHIALQDHGDRVWFRNIRILPLDRER